MWARREPVKVIVVSHCPSLISIINIGEKPMEGNYRIGIDISKRQLDWQVTEASNQQLATGTVQNSPAALRDCWNNGLVRV
ncbi:hypothetical protein SAMN05443144_12853 [Fodinibius roseus]|uniref:Transposase n=1 Tax=Fodinibius roseus TaxID=1194090 RepID=A0A1M5JVF9_9BACT|nr:IS110 family transposase [Fodinibius roseus]SHG44395.1 hypothetical protein SAMN05443144_12853 [Fodinibius roseus]